MTQKEDPVVAVSSVMIVPWLKESLTLTNIRYSPGSPRKTPHLLPLVSVLQLRPLWKQVSGIILPFYHHDIMSLSKEVLVRVCE